MDSWRYSTMLWYCGLSIVGFVIVSLSAMITIRKTSRRSENQIAYCLYLVGCLAVFRGIYEVIDSKIRTENPSGSLRLFFVSLASAILSFLLLEIIKIWVRWRAPGTKFPPPIEGKARRNP